MNYKFLIYISYSYALPIGTPLEKEIKQRGYTVKWFSDEEDGKKALLNKNNQLTSIEQVIEYKPDVVLAATDSVPDFITGLKVQIFHGFFAKKRPKKNGEFLHFRIRGFFDLYCTQGPSTTKEFLKLSKKLKFFEVVETGWSKVDELFLKLNQKKSSNTENSSQQLHTILIASTFTKRLSLAYNNEVFEKIKSLSKSGKYQFKMVLHPKLPLYIKDKWKSLTNEFFTFFDTTDFTTLFLESDILFADTTSVIQEFIIQKKPVVTFNHRVHEDYLINVVDVNDIENAFEQALNPSESILNRIATYTSELHPFTDGKSSQRVIDACISFISSDKSYLKRKPLNLVRKYKIRKRLKYFTFKSYNRAYTLYKNK